MPASLDAFREKVAANGDNLLWYMLFLRVTPLVPNWFVNLACPLVGMPVRSPVILSRPSLYCIAVA